MKQITEQDFWLDKPKMMGVRGWSLLIPATASSIGFFAFGVLAYGFTELDALSSSFRQVLVLVGAFSLAFGSEVGTLAGITEIYRKGERLGRWDKLALGVSVLATFGAFVLAFASLLGVKATWGATVQLYGPIVLGLLAALDSYGGFMEFGLYLNSYDKRIKAWQAAFADFKREQMTVQLDADRRLSERRLQAQLAQVDSEVSSKLSSTAKIDIVTTAQPDTLTVARDERKRQADTALDALLTFYASNPLAKQTEAAAAVSRSRQWVSSRLTELETAGTIKRNGQGVEVLTV